MSHSYEPYLVEITDSEERPFEDGILKEVTEASDGSGWSVLTEDSWGLFVPSLPVKEHGRVLREAIVPKVGDRIRLYGSIGRPIEGIQINDDVVYWRTQEMREAARRRMLEDMDAQRQREFYLLKDDMDRRVEQLPPFFRDRVARFQREESDFRTDSERYEVFCLTEAVKIADHLATTLGDDPSTEEILKAVKAFHDLPWEEQKRLVDIDDGHSNNTFGAACTYAGYYLRHRAGEVVSV